MDVSKEIFQSATFTGTPLNFYQHQLRWITAHTAYAATEILAQKCELLAYGLVSSEAAWSEVRRTGKYPQRVRSGASCGLDIVLPGGTWVNVPVYNGDEESRASLLDWHDGEFVMVSKRTNTKMPVAVVPKPSYYNHDTSTGQPMHFIGQMFTDRIGFGLTNNCYFWKKERRCAFCTIGLNTKEEKRNKPNAEILETLRHALQDPILPPQHVLISGGTFPEEGWSTKPFAELAREIRSFCDLQIYLMTVPPADFSEFEILHQSGVTDIALNIEIYSPALAEKIIPGKTREIGVSRYLEALRKARSYWSREQVRSLLVAGLEPMEATLEGVAAILEAGATPILSAFRPLEGSMLQDHPRPSAEWFEELYYKAQELARSYEAELGPACKACRANCIA